VGGGCDAPRIIYFEKLMLTCIVNGKDITVCLFIEQSCV
jgi:hypothetical protein